MSIIILPFRLILSSGGRIKTEFHRIRPHDLFVVRVQDSAPTLWQRKADRCVMLCRLFSPFDDSFACLQEWELNTQTHQHTVRLDFLNRIAMPSTTRYDSPAFYSKYKAATLGGYNYAVNKEIQQYHVINQFYTETEAHQILSEFSFFKCLPNAKLNAAIDRSYPGEPTFLQPRVKVQEMATESIPTAMLSAEALETIQDIRHSQYLQRTEGN